MTYEDRYANITERVRMALQGLTWKIIAMYLAIVLVVGGGLGLALYEYPPDALKDPVTQKGVVWKVSLIGLGVGIGTGITTHLLGYL